MNKDRLNHSEEIILVRELNDCEYGSGQYKYILDLLVTSNLGLVHKLVAKFPIKNASVSYDDLFQEGIAGLIKGIQKFDTTKGYRLSTYSYNWINAYIRRYFANHGRSVRLPVHVTEAQYQLNKQVEQLTVELGRTPSLAEVTELNSEAVKLLNDVKTTASLNASVGDESELTDICGEDKTEEFDICVDCDIMLSKVKDMVSSRDFNILTMRYGLLGQQERTLQEIADEFDITRARVHQIETSVINKMRAMV